jgi:SAM-dependent methyltransferase
MQTNNTIYSDDFFAGQYSGSLNSAQEVVPVIVKMLPGVKSIVDVGCGTGTWLSVFKKYGISTILGLDGDYVNRDRLLVNSDEFIPANLSSSFTIPGRFDLLISLEVAEHLPASSADEFIRILTSASDCIIFSAAVPNQGGTNHINEQLPSYWISRFEKSGFRCYDYLRPLLWDNPKIAIEYKQNAFLFIKEGSQVHVSRNPENKSSYPFDTIHPDLLAHHLAMKNGEIEFIKQGRLGIKDSFRIFRNAVLNKVK